MLADGLDQMFNCPHVKAKNSCFDKKRSCSQIFVNSIKFEIKLEVQHYKTDSICKVITNFNNINYQFIIKINIILL